MDRTVSTRMGISKLVLEAWLEFELITLRERSWFDVVVVVDAVAESISIL